MDSTLLSLLGQGEANIAKDILIKNLDNNFIVEPDNLISVNKII